MTNTAPTNGLIRTGVILEWCTLLWNVVGVAALAVTAVKATSVALAGFGIDSLVEIGASTVVLWELREVNGTRRRHALRLISVAFFLLALYLFVQTMVVLLRHVHPHHSPLGMLWTGFTALVMLGLSLAKTKVGTALSNQVLISEGRVTRVDAILAATVLGGLALNTLFGWWWADPAAGIVVFVYAVREGVEAWHHSRQD